MSARDNLIAAGYSDPILYLPMDDFEAPGVNLGTGGDFTLNGVVAQSGRGPNQWNCVASEFDGVGDYLSSAGIGATDGKQFVLSTNLKITRDITIQPFVIQQANGNRFVLQFRNSANGEKLRIFGYNASGANILDVETTNPLFIVNKNFFISISIDMNDFSKTLFIVNGFFESATLNVFTNETIDFSGDEYNIADYSEVAVTGELYFDTTYIDLATSNPFWDDDTQKPKPVLQVLEETGNSPLIAMPIRADDAGRNYGTGGDFTVNSGPFIGARGASEFWARSAEFVAASSQDMERTSAIVGAADSKQVSIVFAFNADQLGDSDGLFTVGDVSSFRFWISLEGASGDQLRIYGVDDTGSVVLDGATGSFLVTDTTYVVLMSIDLTSTANRNIYVNGESKAVTWTSYTDSNIELTTSPVTIGSSISTSYFDGSIGFLWFNTEYIDFSQESERLKFVDAFGYPVDIRPKIESGEIPTPLIYMPFDDPNDLGKNLGTGGDFTVNGTVTPGADVSPA